MEYNASVSLVNSNGHTALHIACLGGNYDSVEMLLRRGADPFIRATDGSTPLHCACQADYHECIDMLLECGVDRNCQDNDGNTPLHHLVERFGYDFPVEYYREWLESNAGFDIKNVNGETPLLCAVRNQYGHHFIDDIVELLLMFGSDVNVQGKTVDVLGYTPLHVAVRNNHKVVVQIILNQNPDLKIINNNKETALDLAKELGHNDITQCIEEHLHSIRFQMYTNYRETWCHHFLDSPSNMKLISPVKKRKRMQNSKRERKIKVKNVNKFFFHIFAIIINICSKIKYSKELQKFILINKYEILK